MWHLSFCGHGGKVQCEVLGCLADTFFLIVFKASTTGGAGCRTCQTGDHGRAECHHRGTWPTRSTSYSVYNQLSFLINLMAWSVSVYRNIILCSLALTCLIRLGGGGRFRYAEVCRAREISIREMTAETFFGSQKLSLHFNGKISFILWHLNHFCSNSQVKKKRFRLEFETLSLFCLTTLNHSEVTSLGMTISFSYLCFCLVLSRVLEPM